MGANLRRNLAPRAMTARGAMAAMRLMLRDDGRHSRNFRHLMPSGFGIIGLRCFRQLCLTSFASRRPVPHDFVDAIGRKTSANMTRMTRLAARLTSGRFPAGPLGRLRRIGGRRARRIRRVLVEQSVQFANLLLQLGHPRLQLGHRGSEFKDELIPLPTSWT